MAKIVKGGSFGGCVKYVMDKKDAKLLDSEGVLLENHQTIADSFEAQALLNPRLRRTVGHISLNFSAQDASRISDDFMRQVAGEYMQKMGIENTQFIVVRHNDREHPHCHIVFNRVDNDGRTISDQNDRLRSVRACREITERHGLYIASGKENVKEHRLIGPDKAKYEIYNAIKAALPGCRSWADLDKRLSREGIALTFKHKGGTGQREGIIFGKDGFSFNGSKIDRAFSFSKLDATLNANFQRNETRNAPSFAPSPRFEPTHNTAPSHGHSHDHSSGGGAGLLSLLTPEPGPGGDDNAPMPKPKKKKKQYKPSH